MEFLADYLEHFTYLGLFVILVLAGLGVPFPEDLTIILSGYLSFKEVIRLPIIIPIAIVGVVLGDFLIYQAGRRLGHRVARIWLFRRILKPKRQARVRWFFQRYGNRSIFLVRFVSGVRAAMHLSAGMARMNPRQFLVMDGLAALMSVPILAGVGYYFGDQIDHVVEIFHRIETGSLIAIALGLTVLFILVVLHRRKQST